MVPCDNGGLRGGAGRCTGEAEIRVQVRILPVGLRSRWEAQSR